MGHAEQLELTGGATYSVIGLEDVGDESESEDQACDLPVIVRIEHAAGAGYFQHGGILAYVLCQMLHS